MPVAATELEKKRRRYSSKSYLEELRKEEEEKDKKREEEIQKQLKRGDGSLVSFVWLNKRSG
ncbi:hypothetical protein [Alkalihalobacillus sp. BA299]|uniref:hypothetical protein n=1 Tax=Alkalihalobacillus sp. BA299 TaxID=2815938 RepID=UPI001AD975B9|nr:hypothetical protein [Alkalihalobacillus sp. BA299]